MTPPLAISSLKPAAPLAKPPSATRTATKPATAPAIQQTTRPTPAQPAAPSSAPHSPTTVQSTDPVAASPYLQIRGKPGFWQLAQDTSGIWWFKSPDGKREWLAGITTVQPFQYARNPIGPHYLSRDYSGQPSKTAAPTNAATRRWAAATLPRIKSAGFKHLGAWCHPAFHELDIPITRDLELWKWAGGQSTRLYDPAFTTYVRQAVENLVTPLKDNKNLIGYFSDNELVWSPEAVGPNFYFDYLPPDNPNRREVLKVIRQLWPTLPELNAAWRTSHRSWDEVEAWRTIPRSPTPAWSALTSAFLEHLAGDYFRLTTKWIKEADPNHLIMGVRFRGFAPEEVVRASRDYTDAQSLNYYVSDALLDQQMFEMMYRESGQPVLIGEYAFHSLDGRSGNRNTFGFYGQVTDQIARADGYRLFTTRLARLPYVVGADWFQWNDEPPSGRSSDGEDVNFGIVDIDDRPYELMLTAIRETVPRLNDIHAASHKDSQADLFRDGMANRPTFTAPYLDNPININGELTDWPAAALLTSVRPSRTVGLDRSPIPSPLVLVGWREDGLYFGLQIYDRDIQGSPPSGWWWTQDCAEIFIDTQPNPQSDPSAEDFKRYYDPYCHQFFFAPNLEGPNGIFGTLGQWKRPGDALADSLIPHPTAQHAVRILPDRYVVEVFIPKSALQGWTAEPPPVLGFNVLVRNWQHAAAYFWSAPKEMQTQTRPGTWGTLMLESPSAVPATAIDTP